jgi:methyltransferase (TIGR00027 family)
MRQSQSSLTAMGTAVLRATEFEKPPDERICSDPLARRLIPSWFYAFMKLFMSTGYAEWRGTGIVGFILARSRYIDDVLSDSLEQGLQQLVILGAGFDTRAYRFDGLKGGVKVFEVDHPATQQAKVKKLTGILGPGDLPDYVTFVPIDFTRDSLDVRLPECGYSDRLKTLFIWEGVTEYLDAPSVDDTLAFVSHHSAPGSAVVFDYMYQQVLDGRVKGHSEVSSMRRYRGFSGEVLSFGIEEGQVEPFLLERGFSKVRNVTAAELHERYFKGKNAPRKVNAGYAIAIGIV